MSSTPNGKVKLAIVGAGGISAAHGQGILHHADRVQCVALCDVAPENMAARSAQLGGVAARFSDWNEMYRTLGDQLDAVVICLPHHLHAAAIFDAAAAGKHILCEKPMCINLEEGRRIIAAVREAGVVYMSAHNQLFMESVREAKRLIDSGEIGRVYHIRSQDCFLAGGGTEDPFKGRWRASLQFQGGGELIDTGYHPTYRLLYLAGAKVAAVHGVMGRFRQSIEGEDTASVQVRFENGILGEVFTSWALDLPHGTHQIHICGEKGQIFGSGNDLYILRRGQSEPEKRSMPPENSFIPQMGYFAACLLDGCQPIHGPEEGLEVLEVILKAAQSADGWQAAACPLD